MYVAVTLFLALGAINSQNNLLFCALGLAIGGLLVSGVLSGAALTGLHLEREPPVHSSVGRPTRIRYTLTNRNRLFPAFGLTIEELPGADAGRTPTWRTLIGTPRAFIPGVPAGTAARAEATVVPEHRGRADFVSTMTWSTFPFGLARKSVTFHSPQRTLVFPAEFRLRTDTIDRLTARAPHGAGGERNPGMGDEFFGLREYVPGDSPRRIAWRRTARTGDLVVRQNTTPSPLRLWVVLRVSPGGAPALTERAIAMTAAILRTAADQDVAVGLAIPAARSIHPPRLGRFHLDRLLSELALLGTGASLQEGFPEPAARAGACVIVHDGEIDRSFGPRHAHHLRGADLDSLAEPGEATRRLLGLLDAAPAPKPAVGRSRLSRFLRPEAAA
jgi:uncharacterized protein (DUF58 family)